MTIVLYLMLVGVSLGELFVKNRSGSLFTTGAIFVVAVQFAAYSVFLSASGFDTYGDRSIYALHYSAYYTGYLSHPIDAVTDGFQQPGWAIINLIFRYFTDDICAPLAVTSLMYVLTSLLLIKRMGTGHELAAAGFFLSSLAPLYSLSQSRQFFAIAICNVALILYLKQNRLWVPIVLLAMTIHSSSLVVFAVVFFSGLAKDKAKAISILLLCLGAAVLVTPVLEIVVSVLPFLVETMPASIAGSSEGYSVALKSVPFLLVAIAGAYWFRQGSGKITQVEALPWISSVVSGCAYIAAIANYWLWRISFFFVAPASCCFALIPSKLGHAGVGYAALTLCVVLSLTVRELSMLYPAGY